MIRSLRWRLILSTAAATALILGLSGLILYASIRASLTKAFDSSLVATLRTLQPMIEQFGSKLRVDPELTQMTQFRTPRRPDYFEVIDEATKKPIRSQSLGDASLGVPPPGNDPLIAPLTLPSGLPGRAVAIRFEPTNRENQSEEPPKSPQHAAIFVIARDTQDLAETLTQMRWLLLLVCGGATVASAVLMAGIIRRGLRSTNTLARSISRIDDATLQSRLKADGAPSELLPIVHRLNDLLQRLQDTFQREKSFSSDVAHELRTPLAGLETALEVAASQRRAPEEYERVITRCLDVSRSMHAMVDNLLMLARAESKQLIVQREPMDLLDLCKDAWIHFQKRAADRKLSVEWRAPEDCIVNSDQEKIRLLLHNFFDNAVSYADTGGRITITIDRTPKARLQVANTGSGLSSEDATHVFDRFWRGDRARTASGNHCGLGLTLCQNIVQVLGGRIIAKSEGGIFTVTFELPEPARQLAQTVRS